MSLSNHEAFKNSGFDWLGDVPEAWTVKRIKDTTYLKGRVGWKGLTSDEYIDSGYAYMVTGTDFSRKYINWSECYCVERERYDDDPFIQLREGDLLLTKDGTIGKVALVSGLDRPACLNSGIFLIRPTSSYVTEYMYWVLQAEVFKTFCDLSSMGSTIQHLYQNVFQNFAFPVPTLPEQRRIARFLDRETLKIDALIAEQEKLLRLLAEKRRAERSEAATRGLDKGVALKAAAIPQLNEIPSHWVTGPIKRFFDLLDSRRVPLSALERSSRVGMYPYYGASGVIDSVDDYLFDEDLVLVSEDGANLLSRATPIAYVATGKYWVNNHAHILRPHDGLVEFWAARIEVLDLAPVVSGAAQPKLTADALANLLVAVPPEVGERAAIAKHIEDEGRRLSLVERAAEQAIKLLMDRRASLITAAVTGKVRIDNDSFEAER